MLPIDFDESTKTLNKPDSMTDDECVPLPVWNDDEEQCISCWKGTWRERLKFLITGEMWVGVLSGRTQPPIWLTPTTPFQKEKS